MNLDNFKIVSPMIKTLSVSDMRISSTKLSFNPVTAAELGYPPYVRLLIHPTGRLFAIQACQEEVPGDTIPFFTDAVYEQQKKGKSSFVKVQNRVISQIIRTKMGWGDGKTMRVFGVRYMQEQAIIYNLDDAVLARGSKTKSVTLDEILSSYPTVKDNIGNMLAISPCRGTVTEAEVVDADYQEVNSGKDE